MAKVVTSTLTETPTDVVSDHALKGTAALGPEQNVFGDSTSADKAAAAALRDTYASANADWLATYNSNRSFYIQLQWTGGSEQFQRRNVAGDAWEDAVSIEAGPTGAYKIQNTGSADVYWLHHEAADDDPVAGDIGARIPGHNSPLPANTSPTIDVTIAADEKLWLWTVGDSIQATVAIIG